MGGPSQKRSESPMAEDSPSDETPREAARAPESSLRPPAPAYTRDHFQKTFFFRWLQGEFDHLGIWHFPPEEKPPHDHASSSSTGDAANIAADSPAETFENWKRTVEDMARDLLSQANIRFNAPGTSVVLETKPSGAVKASAVVADSAPDSNPADGSGLLCDHCSKRIAETDHAFSCSVCNDGDFDLCCGCVDQGHTCLQSGHRLYMTKGYCHRGGRSSRKFADKKTRQELRHPSSVQWEDGTLESALDAYMERVNVTAHPRAAEFCFPDSCRCPASSFWPTNMVRKWGQICVLLAEDHLVPSFRSTLSPIQLSSARLLLEWWMGEIQDYRLTSMGIHGTFMGYLLPVQKGEGKGESIRSESALRRFLAGYEKSAYHAHLTGLMCSEFDTVQSIGQDPYFRPVLHHRRETASAYACAQRAATRLGGRFSEPIWLRDADVSSREGVWVAAFSQYCKMLMTAATHVSVLQRYPDDLLDRYASAFSQACKGTILLATENFIRHEQILGRNRLSASLVPCPWLSQVNAFSGQPFFLWDVREQMTVRVVELPFDPVYTAISHTWGRWRIEDDGADVPGVPWPVPRNSRFLVESLPEILQDVPGGSPYIWFDLVCIPQDTVRNAEFDALRQQEVANQAGIFNNAEHAIAWFSDLDSINSLVQVAVSLSINALKFPPIVRCTDPCQLDLRLPKGCFCVDPLLKMATPNDVESAHWSEYIHEWFTSLWTLQEACMRPDMWVCSKSWKTIAFPVASPAESQEILSLDALLALQRYSSEIGSTELATSGTHLAGRRVIESNILFRYGSLLPCQNSIRALPKSVRVFQQCMISCGLINLPYMTPVQILMLGNNRFCGGDRAEAIMSVLGATQWYFRSNQADLVLGRYPLPFVEEVRGSLGHDVFFGASLSKSVWEMGDIEDLLDGTGSAGDKFAGSLLPFGAHLGSDRLNRIPFNFGGGAFNEPHGSLSAWEIHCDGSVQVRSASLLASSQEFRDAESGKGSVGPCTRPPNLRAHIHDLHQYTLATATLEGPGDPTVEDYVVSRWYNVHLVCLTLKSVDGLTDSGSRRWKSFGVILREVGPGRAVKSGWFYTEFWDNPNCVFPGATELNLTVL